MEKRLTLKKETLKILTVEQLRKVAGGLPNLGPGPLASASIDTCNAL